MTLPASGTISLSQVSGELGRAATATTSLGETAVRELCGIASGAISMSNLHGEASLSVTGVNASANFDSTASTGTASCAPSVAVVGGVLPISFLWSFTSNPDGCTLLNATDQTCSVRIAYLADETGSASAVLQCVVTDSAATPNTITVTGVTAGLSWAPA